MRHPAHDLAFAGQDDRALPKGVRSNEKLRMAQDWRDGLVKDHRGFPLSNAANIDYALFECPDLYGLFWWEQLHKRVWLIGRLPHQTWLITDEMRPMTHDDTTALLVYFQRDLIMSGTDRRQLYWSIRKVAKDHLFRLDDDDRFTLPESE